MQITNLQIQQHATENPQKLDFFEKSRRPRLDRWDHMEQETAAERRGTRAAHPHKHSSFKKDQ